jgi:hypothetical protein
MPPRRASPSATSSIDGAASLAGEEFRLPGVLFYAKSDQGWGPRDDVDTADATLLEVPAGAVVAVVSVDEETGWSEGYLVSDPRYPRELSPGQGNGWFPTDTARRVRLMRKGDALTVSARGGGLTGAAGGGGGSGGSGDCVVADGDVLASSPPEVAPETGAAAEAPAAPRAAAPEELPPGWSSAVSRSTGETYFVNDHTGESQYEIPTEAAERLPPGWEARVSRTTGDTYYVHLASNESTYHRPTAADGDALPAVAVVHPTDSHVGAPGRALEITPPPSSPMTPEQQWRATCDMLLAEPGSEWQRPGPYFDVGEALLGYKVWVRGLGPAVVRGFERSSFGVSTHRVQPLPPQPPPPSAADDAAAGGGRGGGASVDLWTRGAREATVGVKLRRKGNKETPWLVRARASASDDAQPRPFRCIPWRRQRSSLGRARGGWRSLC